MTGPKDCCQSKDPHAHEPWCRYAGRKVTRLDDLRALEAAATPGPWHVGYPDGSGEASIVARAHEDALGLDATIVMGGDHDGVQMGVRKPTNAALIAAARNALPALLDVAEVARRLLRRMDVSVDPEAEADALRAALARLEEAA